MSYNDKENSEFEGYPNELYIFVGNGQTWRYTSADEDKNVSGFNFISYPINRGSLEQSLEMARNSIKLTMSKTVPFLNQFRGSPPTSVTNVTILRYHEGLEEYITMWLGRVINIKFLEQEAEVTCEPTYTSLKRPVLRLRYQTSCPHALYGKGCRIASSSYANTGAISYNSGTILKSTAFSAKPDNYFSGGYIDWNTGTNLERRFVLSHTGDSVEINLPFTGMPLGANIVAYPGCNHTLTVCNDKFNNVDNYGGQPFYPGKNPFLGTPIF